MNDIFFYRVVRFLPNFFWPIKHWLVYKLIKKRGYNLKLSPDCNIYPLSKFVTGDNVFINKNFYCSTLNGVTIGDRVMFGANCSIIGGDHKFDFPEDNLRFSNGLGENMEIVIESDAWIGHGTTLIKKAKVGEGTIIGAGSLVNKMLMPYSIYAGNPVRFIRPRFSKIDDLWLHLKYMEDRFSFKTIYNESDLIKIYEKKD